MSELFYKKTEKPWTSSRIRALSFWYSRKGERINFLSHLLGVLLSLVGIGFLLWKTFPKYEWDVSLGFFVYGVSLFLLYLSSTVYHATINPEKKKILQVLDHCAIYLLIAGTYTPFTLTILKESKGFLILILIWSIAIFGIGFKLIFRDKYDLLATMGYLLAGWVIVLDMENFYLLFARMGFYWILAGGVLYSIGAIFYLIEKMPRNHEIWHMFVLSASVCHYIGIYFYL
jgi:hemolysin III